MATKPGKAEKLNLNPSHLHQVKFYSSWLKPCLRHNSKTSFKKVRGQSSIAEFNVLYCLDFNLNEILNIQETKPVSIWIDFTRWKGFTSMVFSNFCTFSLCTYYVLQIHINIVRTFIHFPYRFVFFTAWFRCFDSEYIQNCWYRKIL